MGIGKLTFEETLRQQTRSLLPYLDSLKQQGVKYVTRQAIIRRSGLSDNEVQKLIHDNHMPRHTLKVRGQKAYDIDTTLRMLARWCRSYEYLVVV